MKQFLVFLRLSIIVFVPIICGIIGFVFIGGEIAAFIWGYRTENAGIDLIANLLIAGPFGAIGFEGSRFLLKKIGFDNDE